MVGIELKVIGSITKIIIIWEAIKLILMGTEGLEPSRLSLGNGF